MQIPSGNGGSEEIGRILEESLNEIFIFDAESLKFLQVNRGARANLGYSMEELREFTPSDLKPNYTAEAFGQLIEPVKTGQQDLIVFETVHRRRNGSHYDVEVHLQRASYQGRDAFVAIILDITERKRVEHDLRQRDQAIATGATAIVFADLAGNITYANRAFLDRWGYAHEDEVLGRPNVEFSSSPEDVSEVMRGLNERGEWIGERLAKRKDGSLFEIQMSSSVVTDERGKPVSTMASFVDISERIRAEERLRVQQRAVESAVNGVVITDPNQQDNPIIYVNPAMEKITGYSAKEVIGRNCRFLQNDETEQEALVEVRSAIHQQRECRVMLRNYRRDGTLFWNELTIAPVLDPQGRLTHFVGTLSDITEKKQAEQQLDQLNKELESRVRERTRQLDEAQEALIRKEKLATLGQLAGGVAHEIRNPLGVIKNAVYYLTQTQTKGDEGAKEALDEITRGLKKSERIISELLDYARSPESEPSPFCLQEAINHALQMVRIPSDVQVVRPSDSLLALGDRTQVERLLANLVQNAIQAMPDGGTLTIACDAVDQQVITQVTDTGIGIAEQDQERIFEPLFTKRAKGIGLGLALCRRYAQLNDGSLSVESQLGAGSTFKLTLPLAE